MSTPVAAARQPSPAPKEKKKDQDLSELLDVTAGMRSRLLTSWKVMLKDSMTGDPDMWTCVRHIYAGAVENVWVDVEHEVERSLEKAAVVRTERERHEKQGPTSKHALKLGYLQCRAFMLSHFLPFNKSIFGKLNDPIYVVMYLITLLPIQGLRVAFFSIILLMLFFPGPPDEFQLINFILLFKGMQFLTGGIVQLALGSYKYFACYSWHKDNVLECIMVQGPGTGNFWHMLLDYLGNILLVWVAFFALPYARNLVAMTTKRSLERQRSVREEERRRSSVDEEVDVPQFGGLAIRGGKMRRLIQYDMACFSLSVVALFVVTLLTDGLQPTWFEMTESPQFKANVFWCMVLYGMLSFPFLMFQLPFFLSVLTHSDPSGFNRHGACVPFGLEPVKTQEVAGAAMEAGSSYSTWYAAANTITTLLRIAENGRVARGGDSRGDYQKGDFSRGLYNKILGGGPQPKSRSKSTRSSLGDGPVEGSRAVTSTVSSATSGSSRITGPSIAAQGRQLHGSLATAEYQLGHFSLGLWAMMAGGSKNEDEMPVTLAIASVRIPAEDVEKGLKDKVIFCIRVDPEGSLDAEYAMEPWSVLKCYSDFHELSEFLGPTCQSYTDAPFPTRMYMMRLDEEVIEARRAGLEAWLNKVIYDAAGSSAEWGRPLHDFLYSNGSTAVKSRGAPGGSEGGLPSVPEHSDGEGAPGRFGKSGTSSVPTNWFRSLGFVQRGEDEASSSEAPSLGSNQNHTGFRDTVKTWFCAGPEVLEDEESQGQQEDPHVVHRSPVQCTETLSDFLSETSSDGDDIPRRNNSGTHRKRSASGSPTRRPKRSPRRNHMSSSGSGQQLHQASLEAWSHQQIQHPQQPQQQLQQQLEPQLWQEVTVTNTFSSDWLTPLLQDAGPGDPLLPVVPGPAQVYLRASLGDEFED